MNKSSNETKETSKDKINPVLLSIGYLFLSFCAIINCIRYFDINEYKNSLLKEIIDKFITNFLFSINLSIAIGFILLTLVIIFYSLFNANSFKGVINFLFIIFLITFIFLLVLLSLSITKDNAESFIAFVGLVWAMIKVLPFVYNKIKENIRP